jgi:hypothetical protein
MVSFFGQLKGLSTATVTRVRRCMPMLVSVVFTIALACVGLAQSNREVYNYNLNFTTQNQCMWQQGTCNVVYNYSWEAISIALAPGAVISLFQCWASSAHRAARMPADAWG